MATAAAANVKNKAMPRSLGGRPLESVQQMAGGEGYNIAGTRRKHKTQLGDEQYSNFFITVNTNFKTRDHELAVAQLRALREVTRQMLGSPEILKVLDVDPNAPITFPGRENLLEPIKTKIASEFGPAGSVHTHSDVRIHHTTRVFFNRAKMKAFIRDRMNAIGEQVSGAPWFKGRGVPNIKVKLLADPRQEEKLKRYLEKDAALSQVEETF